MMRTVKRQLEAVMRMAGASLLEGADAVKFAELLYDEDVIVVGEGWPAATRGILEAIPKVDETLKYWGDRPRLSFTIVGPIVTEGSVATTFVDVKVASSEPAGARYQYRALYGWKRGIRGWRVALEMYDEGAF
jgi:ketosteroid isomerase-like protein